MLFCPNCQQSVPEGHVTCPRCCTPIDYAAVAAGQVHAAHGEEYAVGGINWSAIVLGAVIALGLWNGGMYGLTLLFGTDAMWFGIMVKVTAIFSGSLFAGYRSYSAELTHGLLVAAIVAAVNGAVLVFVLGVQMTTMLVLVDFVFIDFGTALAGASIGAKLQR
jgi:hypothetical protein